MQQGLLGVNVLKNCSIWQIGRATLPDLDCPLTMVNSIDENATTTRDNLT